LSKWHLAAAEALTIFDFMFKQVGGGLFHARLPQWVAQARIRHRIGFGQAPARATSTGLVKSSQG